MRASRGYANSFNTFGDFTPRRERPVSPRQSNQEGAEAPRKLGTGDTTPPSSETSGRVPVPSLEPSADLSAAWQIECRENLFGDVPYSWCTGCERAGCTEVFQTQEAYWDHIRRYASPEQQRAAAELDRCLEGYTSESEIQECGYPGEDSEDFLH